MSGNTSPARRDRRIDRAIDTARSTAKTTRAPQTVTRPVKNKAGEVVRHDPVLEVSEHGDVAEIPAPRMTTTIGDRLGMAWVTDLRRLRDKAAAADRKRPHFSHANRRRVPQQALIGRAIVDGKEPR